MTATALIGRAAAMISPHGIAEIERAWIRGRSYDRAADGTDCGTCPGIAGNCADRGACAGAEKTAAHGTIAGICSTGRKHERRDECRRKDETTHLKTPVVQVSR
jgi:hypothetical protein